MGQIFEVAKELSKYTDLRVLCLYGGIGATEQIKQIKEGVDIIVATPGRLMDLYRKENLDLRQVKTLILDEADRLMDMGFMPQLRQLQEKMLQKKQVKFPHKTTVGEWHDVLVQVAGETFTLSLDGEEVGSFTSPGIAHPTKRMLRLSVPKNVVVDDVKFWRKK